MDRLAAMSAFCRVVEAGSFSVVARELRTTQSAVSKQVAALERHLGVRLLNRTTRALSLTDEGRVYFDTAQRLVREADEAEQALRDGQRALAGRLRIGASVAFGRLVMFDIARDFMAAHPKIELDIRLADHFVDLVAEGLDLTVRAGELADSSLIAQRVGTAERAAMASRRYVDALPASLALPAVPEDLARHDCLLYSGLATGNAWVFESPSGPRSVRVNGRLTTNSSEVIRRALLEGLGVAFAPVYLFHEELARGEVVRLLPGFAARALPINVLYPPSRRNAAKVAAFTEALRQGLGNFAVVD
ncbi:MAG: LysR family transcriptional regulator [Betaproteobacteria bacterium]|nr:LysR family transcriptional regulator [Betaproteobacteria bacterium]